MKTMNEKQQAATSREAYEAPKCEIIEIQQEGVLCGSFGTGHDGYGNGDYKFGWD